MSSTDGHDRSQASLQARRGVLHAFSALAPVEAGPRYDPVESNLQRLKAAVLGVAAPDPFEIIHEMRKTQVSGALIAESYVPRVARWLGDAWLTDELPFTSVTIACARLQTLVRRLDTVWTDMPQVQISTPPRFLVGICEGVQHSLGATILAGILRSRGYSVVLDLELTPQSMREKLNSLSLSGVFLSISDIDQFDRFNALIQEAKNVAPNVPTVLGGAVLDQETDIRPLTQADLITCDIDEALRFCRVSLENEEDMIDFSNGAGIEPLGKDERDGANR